MKKPTLTRATPVEELIKELFNGNVIHLDDYATNPKSVNRPIPEDDLEGLNDPSCWPHRPLLPVKKREGRIGGVVVEGEPGRVYLAELWNLIGESDKAVKAALGRAATVEFDSWEEMLKDGWVVD
jgi:hypothetical protein